MSADLAPGARAVAGHSPVAPAEARAGLSLGVLAHVVGYHLAQATVTATLGFERHVGQPLKLRKVEYSLLMLVLANDALTPKRLGHALALTAPNLTLTLDRLQQRGLILRERNQTDRRSQHIVLTAEGRRLAEAGSAAAVHMEREVEERLSPAERLMLIELLRKVAGR